ncbi:glycosyltransferase [Hymenobacter taeanensis]|uniref:Glycosyltransferase n=1 Tax=Hymenobacter taeanensis TaxID=2735321 RepID=A0A6M6BF86_9BACT|nr:MULTISPECIES: glycosyltransferase [Hymenobacter]QJX47251.1 glycosyltransferase [Hymenobacter taeanensis]UOQ79413.1 glycosyltransferase [Hymenobacter sp. 5414T-23]
MSSVLPSRFHAVKEAAASPAPALTAHVARPPAAGLRMVVVVPAKNEAENLPDTLAALVAQTTLTGYPLNPAEYEIIVLANNCSDQTAAVARQFAACHPAVALHVLEVRLPRAEAHIGKARRLLMDEACRRLELVNNPASFIASTDADTQVAPTWLAATEAALAQGADAVGGRILMKTPTVATACVVRRYQLQDAAYQLLRARLEALLDPQEADPWPRHHQHFGASFALTPAAYRHVGGLPVVPYLEDEALYQALLRHDLCLRHSPEVRVYTSGRQKGRVAVGLSWQLRQWAKLGQLAQEPLVESPARLVKEWKARCALRALWQGRPAGTLAETLPTLAASMSLPLKTLERQMHSCLTFGQLWSWVRRYWARNGRWEAQWPAMALTDALAYLRRELATHALSQK